MVAGGTRNAANRQPTQPLEPAYNRVNLRMQLPDGPPRHSPEVRHDHRPHDTRLSQGLWQNAVHEQADLQANRR